MSEAEMNRKTVLALNKLPGVFVQKRWGGPGQKGQVDITGIVIVQGFGVRIELEGKLPGETPTPKQSWWLNKWSRFGALTGVYHSVDEAVFIVQKFRNELEG